MTNVLTVKKMYKLWSLAFFLFGLLAASDQLSKVWAGNIFRNYDFAFGLRVNPFVMYGVYGLVLCAIGYYLFREHRRLTLVEAISWLAVLAGGLSNLAERIALGYVRDFIYLMNGVFNLADFYIIAGSLILLARELRANLKSH